MSTKNNRAVDEMVQMVQQWLNDTFPEKFKYDPTGENSGEYPVQPDGMTGNTTVTALVMALQLHLGLDDDGIWGSGTTSHCPTITASTTDEILIRILQGGFYCKGYQPKGFDGVMGAGTLAAINSYKLDLGLDANSELPADVFKSLLTMDASKLSLLGTYEIRQIQQYLNGSYGNLFKSKLGYLPTGGIYERKTNKALIYAFQSAIGTTPDGAIGNNTYNAMPTLSKGSNNQKLIRILEACLICNGYSVSFDGNFSDTDEAVVREFQEFMCLNLDPAVTLGSVNRRTWSALLQSKGDPERTANACDTATIIDSAKATALKANGYNYIGRYLTGTVLQDGVRVNKALSISEIQAITDAGMKIFAIYQDGGASANYFNRSQGAIDAQKAITAAEALHIPHGEIIYFAVDYDFTDNLYEENVRPHFSGIRSTMENAGSPYRIGIYASRNICSRAIGSSLACSAFVADMSTGYSGNLGYPMPDNWAFEQYHEFTFTSNGVSLPLDKNIASGRYEGFDANSRCGGNNYADVTLHGNMTLIKDEGIGYYLCDICNHQFLSPAEQDKAILSFEDSLMVKAAYIAFYYYNDMNRRGFMTANTNIARNMLKEMRKIRAKYTGYQFSDAEGVPVIEPLPYYPMEGDSYYDDDLEIAKLRMKRGSEIVWHDVISGMLENIGSWFIPVPVYQALSLEDELMDIIQNPDTTNITLAFLDYFAGKSGYDSLGVILDIISVGIDANNTEEEIAPTDYVVTFRTVTAQSSVKESYVIFDESGKIKDVIFSDLISVNE